MTCTHVHFPLPASCCLRFEVWISQEKKEAGVLVRAQNQSSPGVPPSKLKGVKKKNKDFLFKACCFDSLVLEAQCNCQLVYFVVCLTEHPPSHEVLKREHEVPFVFVPMSGSLTLPTVLTSIHWLSCHFIPPMRAKDIKLERTIPSHGTEFREWKRKARRGSSWLKRVGHRHWERSAPLPSCPDLGG